MALSIVLWSAGLMVQVVYAQRATTTATCGSSFDWMSNSRDQSPCLVAAYLQGACGSGAWTVPLLPFTAGGAQQTYLPPNSTTRNICSCSAAVYNLMSACAACQNGGWLLYAPWSLECENGNMLGLPNSFPPSIPIPSDTIVPEYALVDPRAWSGGGLNISEARGVALGAVPPSLTLSTSTSPASTTNSPSSTSSSVSSSAAAATSNAPARQDNTGAIVGGVVGGILGISLVAVLILWLLCGKRLGSRLSHTPPQNQKILGHEFPTPTAPLAPPSIVVPIPMRPFPLKNGFQSWMSASTAGSQAGDHYGSQHPLMVSPKPYVDARNGGTGYAGVQAAVVERGGGVQFSPEPTVQRTNTTSSAAHALFRRVTSSLRRPRRGLTISSVGSGTNMTSIPADSESGHGSQAHNVSRPNTSRRMAEPVPFVMPARAEDIPSLDASSGVPTNGQQAPDYSQFYGLSATEEKRRLNPPAYATTTPFAPHTRNPSPPQMSERTNPNHSASYIDLISGGATTGSRSNVDPTEQRNPGQVQELQSASRYRPSSDPMSLPSNLMLSSPMEMQSQDASSGMLDSSPIVPRPVPPSHLRFVVANPTREVEM